MKYYDIQILKQDNPYFKANPEKFEELINFINTKGSGFAKALTSNGISHKKYYIPEYDHSQLRNWINAQLPLLQDPIYTMSTKCYWILHGITDFPKCTNERCKNYNTSKAFIGKNVKLSIGYSRFCNRKCQNTHKDVLKKQEESCLDHFGVKFSLQVKEVRDKGIKTLQKNYNVSNPGQLQKNHDIQLTKSYENFILNNEYDEPMFTLNEYLKRESSDQLLTFRCKRCGNIFEAIHSCGYHRRCEKCFPSNQISYQEKDIVEFIRTQYDGIIIENDTSILKPKELDIYLPMKKLAIEYDGLYWHSDSIKDSTYHLNKTNACENQGIQLIHIFENEWMQKQQIVKSNIKSLLGIYRKTIDSTACTICQVDKRISNEFQLANHIQGSVNAKIHIGLYNSDELVSLMTFDNVDELNNWKILRFCNKLGYNVIESAKSLLDFFENTIFPNRTYITVDRRWNQEKTYTDLGFTLQHITKPNGWYWISYDLIDSQLVDKNMLQSFDTTKTLDENMKSNGYRCIFDCGNLVFEKVNILESV